jgi:hypothetical protein
MLRAKIFKTKIKLSLQQAVEACRVEILKIPYHLDNRLTDGSKVVSPTHWPRFIPQKHNFPDKYLFYFFAFYIILLHTLYYFIL